MIWRPTKDRQERVRGNRKLQEDTQKKEQYSPAYHGV
jgi:hypothetical protein